ncbi:MAG: barstar family protein [Kiritimatiellae bacterium]|nr:barstar family protein [Kiritimatiellia bacterium]
MAQYTINLAEIPDAAALHETLSKKLRFPRHYGKNLDALFDTLTSSAAKRELVFCGGAEFWKREPEFFPRFVQVLLNAEMEVENLSVTLQP